jgi:hypothetical protein
MVVWNMQIKKLKPILFLSILLVGLLAVLQIEEVYPSVVGTGTSDSATYHPFQRKSFYANGRFWVFYSDGTNMVYRTSTDGQTWSSATTVRSADCGYRFSVWFDGTYLHYAYASLTSIYYRRGTPNSDGTITWSASEQTVSTTYNRVYYPMVSVDSSGYVWIGYQDNDGSNCYPYVIKSGNNDGTWGTTPSGFPYRLSTTSSSSWVVSVIPLTSGKMLAVYTYDGATVKAKAWNGTAWGTEVSTTSVIQYGIYHSAVAQGDDVHLTFLKYSSYDILYVKYTYATNSFGSETTLQAYTTDSSPPLISIDTSTNDLYVFAATETTGSPSGWTADHIYYIKYTASSGTWGTWTDWIDETTETLCWSDAFTIFYQAYGNYIGLEYMTKQASPYNVKFAYLTLPNQAPTIGQFQAPSGRINTNSYFYLNATVNDVNGVNDLQNATLTLNYTINLNWFSSTNTFTKTGDVNNYCTLGSGSTRTTINSTAYKLSWNISLSVPLSWHVISAVVFDSAGASGTSSAANLFITDYINVSTFSVSDNRINVGETASFTVNGTHAYDGSVWHGTYTLNDTTSKSTVGKYGYKVSSITDSDYGLTAFNQTASDLYVIWDKVDITTFSVADSRINVGDTATFAVGGKYEYDSSAWSGTYTLNDTASKSAVGKYTYSISSITDTNYGLTAFEQTAGNVDVIFDKLTVTFVASSGNPAINQTVIITWTITRQYDGSTVSTFTINIDRDNGVWLSGVSISGYTDVSSEEITHIYTATAVNDVTYGITAFDTNSVAVVWGAATTELMTFVLFGLGIIFLTIGVAWGSKEVNKRL